MCYGELAGRVNELEKREDRGRTYRVVTPTRYGLGRKKVLRAKTFTRRKINR